MNWLNRFYRWIGLHHWSTWGILVSLIMMAGVAHPSLAAYLAVAMNGCWQFINRDIARAEGSITRPRWYGVAGGVLGIAVCLWLIVRIQWLAL
jgi:hypothetical protein